MTELKIMTSLKKTHASLQFKTCLLKKCNNCLQIFWWIHLNYSFMQTGQNTSVKYISLLPALAVPCELQFQNPLLCRCRCRCLWCSGRRKRWVEAEEFWLSAPPLGWASSPTPPGSQTLHNIYRISGDSGGDCIHLAQALPSGQATITYLKKQTPRLTYHHQKTQTFSQVCRGTTFHSRLWLLTQSPHLKHYPGPFISF